MKWEPMGNVPRRAGISAFGLTGTLAHVVVEEYEQENLKTPQQDLYAVPLSAKSLASLVEAAKVLSSCLENNPFDLADVAYTLQTGRESFPYRKVFLVRDQQALLAELHEINETSTFSHCPRDRELDQNGI